nr:MAG TPA: hypothetical protein [Caudoviricetes sp.]
MGVGNNGNLGHNGKAPRGDVKSMSIVAGFAGIAYP